MSSMQMMAPFTHSPAHAVQASQYSDTPTSSQGNAENGAQRKKNRWTDTEEKILIELFGENEDKLRYRSFNSPEDYKSHSFSFKREHFMRGFRICRQFDKIVIDDRFTLVIWASINTVQMYQGLVS